jgi:streptogramin lyase/plastocyanin
MFPKMIWQKVGKTRQYCLTSILTLMVFGLTQNGFGQNSHSHNGMLNQNNLTSADGREISTVVLKDEAPYFSPKRLKVSKGGIVKWENKGPGLVHTIAVSTDAGVISSGAIRPGETFTFDFKDFDNAVVKAACEVHPYMFGIVIIGSPADSLISAVETKPEAKKKAEPKILEFSLPIADSVPGILEIDAEDNVWFTMGGGGFANINFPPLAMIGKMTLDGDLSTYHLPTKASAPDGLVLNADGTLYITEFLGNKIAKMDAQRKIIEEFTIPTPDANPTALALDSKGNLWFNENKGNKVGRLSPNGIITEFVIPTINSRPTGMVIDREDRVWFAERDGNKIGCIHLDGTIVEYSIPTPKAKPTAMAVDEKGRVWFSERQGNKIAVIENGKIKEYPLPNPNSGPFFILIDGNGHIWFSEIFGDRIGDLNPDTGNIVEYDIPTKDSWVGGIAMDSQGNVWYALQLKNKIGVIIRSAHGENH